MVGPTKCIEHNPNPRTVYFGGRFINLSEIARTANVTQGYLSKVFSGSSGFSVKTLIGISAALGMSLDDFIWTMESHLTTPDQDQEQPQLDEIVQ